MKKICILGKLNTKYEAPFEDKSWEIWLFNEHPDTRSIPRIDKRFNLHPYAANFNNLDYSIKNFPFKECEKLVGGEYFNNSLSYLIAFAILEGADKIAIFGCNYTGDKIEREKEYLNVRELVFFAKGRGIQVIAPVDHRINARWYRYIDWRTFRKDHNL